MLLRSESQETLSVQESSCRIVIGAGAVGLFLSHIIKSEKPLDFLSIISKSLVSLPFFIQFSSGQVQQVELPPILTLETYQDSLLEIKNQNIIFYVTTPPEVAYKAYEYAYKILNKLCGHKSITFVFMNNGFVDYQLFLNFKSSMESKKFFSIFFVRAIVVSGFMREKQAKGTLIRNTAGNKIYYGFYENEVKNCSDILPHIYYNFVYDEDIFLREKSKFFTNFLLALIINNNLLENYRIYSIMSREKIEEIVYNYCLLFSEKTLTPEYVGEQFFSTIETASLNINSISYAWYYGNKNTIDYFIMEIKNIMDMSKNIEAIAFFENLISHFYSK